MVSIKHAFQSAKSDDPDAFADGQVTPSRWNADLDTSMATARVLGRNTAGTGAIEELAASTVRSMLNVQDGADPTGATMAAATAKTTPVDADTFAMSDSVASNALKKITWANIKATLKTYFDTLYQPVSAKLTALAGQTWAADQITYQTSASAVSTTALTSFGRSLIDDADASTARTTLGLVIGTNVQAQNAKLSDIATATFTTGDAPVWNGTNFVPQAAGGGSVIKSIKYYDVAATSLTTGSGAEAKYLDVTVTGTNAAKMVADFFGSGTTGAEYQNAIYFAGGTSEYSVIASAKVISATLVRIAFPNAVPSRIFGRLRVVEYN